MLGQDFVDRGSTGQTTFATTQRAVDRKPSLVRCGVDPSDAVRRPHTVARVMLVGPLENLLDSKSLLSRHITPIALRIAWLLVAVSCPSVKSATLPRHAEFNAQRPQIRVTTPPDLIWCSPMDGLGLESANVDSIIE